MVPECQASPGVAPGSTAGDGDPVTPQPTQRPAPLAGEELDVEELMARKGCRPGPHADTWNCRNES